jgi:hypothetical protein
MNYEKLFENATKGLSRNCAEVLLQGLELSARLSDSIYVSGGRGSVGTHMRHCLEFATAFLNGLNSGQIDYSSRERDANIEQNREYALSRIAFAIRELNALQNGDLDKPVMVKLDELSGSTDEPEWAWSSGKRELEFVQSHTVHHFALIAYKLRALGISIDEGFGVAPSTLKHWEKESRESQAG